MVDGPFSAGCSAVPSPSYSRGADTYSYSTASSCTSKVAAVGQFRSAPACPAQPVQAALFLHSQAEHTSLLARGLGCWMSSGFLQATKASGSARESPAWPSCDLTCWYLLLCLAAFCSLRRCRLCCPALSLPSLPAAVLPFSAGESAAVLWGPFSATGASATGATAVAMAAISACNPCAQHYGALTCFMFHGTRPCMGRLAQLHPSSFIPLGSGLWRRRGAPAHQQSRAIPRTSRDSPSVELSARSLGGAVS